MEYYIKSNILLSGNDYGKAAVLPSPVVDGYRAPRSSGWSHECTIWCWDAVTVATLEDVYSPLIQLRRDDDLSSEIEDVLF